MFEVAADLDKSLKSFVGLISEARSEAFRTELILGFPALVTSLQLIDPDPAQAAWTEASQKMIVSALLKKGSPESQACGMYVLNVLVSGLSFPNTWSLRHGASPRLLCSSSQESAQNQAGHRMFASIWGELARKGSVSKAALNDFLRGLALICRFAPSEWLESHARIVAPLVQEQWGRLLDRTLPLAALQTLALEAGTILADDSKVNFSYRAQSQVIRHNLFFRGPLKVLSMIESATSVKTQGADEMLPLSQSGFLCSLVDEVDKLIFDGDETRAIVLITALGSMTSLIDSHDPVSLKGRQQLLWAVFELVRFWTETPSSRYASAA